MAEKANESERRDVYISYSRSDTIFVQLLHNSLKPFGFSAWAEFDDLPPGSDWQAELDQRLDSAHTLLFVISGASINSKSCIRELERAIKSGKRIIPLLHQPVSVELLPVELARLNWIDFSQDLQFESSFRKLIDALNSPQTQPVPPPPIDVPINVDPPEIKQESATIISLQAPSSTTVVNFAATPALAQLLAKATRINQAIEREFDLSFSSLLLAFLASDDPLSQWFSRYVKEAGIAIDELLKGQRLERSTLDRVITEPLNETELSTLDRPRLRTESAKRIFEQANTFSQYYIRSLEKPPNKLLDVRHLMAAYIYAPGNHESDLEKLRFDRLAWSNAFLGQIKNLYPQELELWKEIHFDKFTEEPAPVEEIEGPSTHIASDMWTLNDTLGYRAYAHAIYRFMTHPQTTPPLTISIQAPWGGGKTSLMRMIQHALDPTAFKEVEAEAKRPRGVLTIGETLDEVRHWIEPNPVDEKTITSQVSAEKQQEQREALPETHLDRKRELLTIWFNAWKYESVNQIWAGLVDAIMQQVAARLPLAEREMFWLRLNLKRVDADKIRQRIHERVFRYWWRAVRYLFIGVGTVVVAFTLVVISGWIATSKWLVATGGLGTFLSFISGILLAARKYTQAKTTVKDEPAAVSLSEFLDIPNYSAEMGFIHRVEADLRRVLDSVPDTYRPIVIFIDDLDRCSPVKVAQVVEAVNLFLAGDFPHCMFIMGMDTEMVAAALQAAHKDMISFLPADAGIPVGWRFMDKFVQLPFLVPPTEKGNLARYTTSLFTQLSQKPDQQVDSLAQDAASRVTTRGAIEGETERLRVEHKLSDTQVSRMKDQLEARVVERKLDEGIEKFTDDNPDIKRVIAAATSYFRGNPRELKRFINSFRFQYFLWWAQHAQGFEVPSLDQLRRWTVLSMKWPEVVRWLRRSGGSEWRVPSAPQAKVDDEAILPTRLKLLEDVSEGATDLATWHARALKDLRLKPETTSWLNDDDLLQFFYEECNKYPSGKRLSDGLGKGLW